MRPRHALACALLAWLTAAPAAAQQIKPYFLLVVDTSGSMDSAGSTITGAPSCTNASYPATKIGHAKCALTKILNSTGDAEFGLMQYSKASNNTDCGNVGTCEPVAAAGWMRVPIETNSWKTILPLVDGNGAGPADELCAGGNTPLGGSMLAAKQYWESGKDQFSPPTQGDAALACRPLSVILLTDGDECCGTCSTIVANNPVGPGSWQGCPKAHAATGITCATGCTTVTTCSNNNFSESAPELAYNMLTESMVPSANGTVSKRIPTYVIGFGIAEGDTHIENIAKAGGTDNPSDGAGGLHGFYATNEASLSLALNQIIADAQPPTEVCNNADDDCDMKIDEGIPKFCDKPNGVNDKTLCDEPPETKCDGEDDDCDGLIDEGVLNACGQCGKEPKEICDGVDNDCDGNIDEMTDGGECGTDVGNCKKGTLRCIGGEPTCTGGVQPSDELCNCKDDDCDGMVDEDVDGKLCAGSACVSCMCVPRCEPDFEFMPICNDPKLLAEIQPNGECLCITDNCDPSDCRGQTLKRDDKVACAPNREDIGTCMCRGGECGSRCDGVACDDSETCDTRSGKCVENNCRGLGCADGQLCDPMTTKCTDDACADVECKPEEVCRDGDCEKSCAKVKCMSGQRCESGRCVKNPCGGVACEAGEACNPENGKCIKNPCANVACAKGLTCEVPSGMCERDPCWNVHCPADQTCMRGECLMKDKAGQTPSTIGNGGTERDGDDPNQRLLASGGGGCACRVTAGTPAGGNSAGLAGMLSFGLALALVRRRLRFFRGRRQLALIGGLLALAVVVGTSGCDVTPFCVDCMDAGKAHNGAGGSGGHAVEGDAQVDGGKFVSDSGGSGGSVAPGDAGPDAMTLPTCTDKKPEVCNGKDDDCDFIADEDTQAEKNDCDQHGICAGTEPVCVNGKFICRYPDEREDEETKCDGKDNDCDGRVDETFKGLGLGKDCQVGTGACQVTGKQVCNDGGNGLRCEVDKTIDPADEICDGIDNDCDGDVDEPKSKPGSAPSYVHDDVVQISSSKWIYKYEASRPDAEDKKSGIITTRACSRAGVLPWTGLTYSEAKAACAAADMQLCALADWINACDGSDTCKWSLNGGSCPAGGGTDADGYPTDASPSNKNACNGHDLQADPGDPNKDALAPTGSYANCYSSLLNDDKAFDMSGNAKEWTIGPDSESAEQQSPLRGGSYNNLPGGLRCDFDFSLATNDTRLPNVGFRCCSDDNPN